MKRSIIGIFALGLLSLYGFPPAEAMMMRTRAQVSRERAKKTEKAKEELAKKQLPMETQALSNPQEVVSKKCNDLILILDPGKNETTDGKSRAMGFKLVDALQEKTAPIITTNNVVNNFCFWKTTHKEILNAIKETALTTKSISDAEEKAQALLEQLEESQTFDQTGYFSVILSGTELHNNDWLCYAHKESNLILLIPRNYITQHVQNSTIDIKDQIAQCGFNITNLNHIPHVSPEKILDYIQNNSPETSANLIDSLKSMFIHQNKSEIQQTTGWNIYVTGHGNISKKKKSIKQELKDHSNSIKFWQNSVKFWQTAPGNEEKKNRYLKDAIEQVSATKKTLQSLSMQLQSLQGMPDEAIIQNTAHIAGMDLKEFTQLMEFFNTDIKTLFLHYSTCFAGGYNQAFVNETLEKLNVDFIVSSQGATESSTHAWNPDLIVNDTATDLILSQKRFDTFFMMLESFFGEPASFATTKNTLNALGKDPIATIIRNIIDVDQLDYNQPFVRIPAAGTFNALSVDKKVKILTNSIVKAHEFENRSIDITDPSIELVVMYPDYIAVPLNMRAHISIISPTPHIITPNHQSLHIFDKLISTGSLSSLIGNLIWLNSSYSTITFIIKNLTCLDEENSGFTLDGKQPTDIQDVIVNMKGDLSPDGHIDMDIDVLFTCDGTHYAFSQQIADLAHNNDTFWDIFQDLPATEISPESLNTLALKILHLKNIAQIPGKQATIPIIIEQLDKKIDKTFRVQKPGMLKKNLLLHQLKNIETELSSQQLQEQQIWFMQNKKSSFTLISRLKKHSDDLTHIKKQIEQLASLGELSKQDEKIFFEKIESIKTKINKTIAIFSVQKKAIKKTSSE